MPKVCIWRLQKERAEQEAKAAKVLQLAEARKKKLQDARNESPILQLVKYLMHPTNAAQARLRTCLSPWFDVFACVIPCHARMRMPLPAAQLVYFILAHEQNEDPEGTQVNRIRQCHKIKTVAAHRCPRLLSTSDCVLVLCCAAVQMNQGAKEKLVEKALTFMVLCFVKRSGFKMQQLSDGDAKLLRSFQAAQRAREAGEVKAGLSSEAATQHTITFYDALVVKLQNLTKLIGKYFDERDEEDAKAFQVGRHHGEQLTLWQERLVWSNWLTAYSTADLERSTFKSVEFTDAAFVPACVKATSYNALINADKLPHQHQLDVKASICRAADSEWLLRGTSGSGSHQKFHFFWVKREVMSYYFHLYFQEVLTVP